MQIKINVDYFRCPKNMGYYLEKVFSGEYEVPLYYKDEQPVVLDLGANCGAFSLWAAHRWPGCKVHAFEPHPEAFQFLTENTQMYGNIYAHKYAVGEPGIRVLLNGTNNLGESSLYLVENNTDLTGQHVEVTDPLSLPADARVLKMDIEGCEVEVLEPLLKAGRKFDAVMYEYHNSSIRHKMEDLLRADYTLTNALVTKPGLGVMCFMHRELMK